MAQISVLLLCVGTHKACYGRTTYQLGGVPGAATGINSLNSCTHQEFDQIQPSLQVWAPHWCLHAPRVEHTENEAAMAGPHPSLHVHVNNSASMGDLGSVLYTPSDVAWTTLQILWAVSMQVNHVLFLDQSTEA